MALLNKELQNKIDALQLELGTFLKNNEVEKALDTLEEAWALIPENKFIYDESYHIARYSMIISQRNGLESKAIYWAEIIQNCDLERADDGERELLAGKVYFDFNHFEKAKYYFVKSWNKMNGFAFKGEDEKYVSFVKKYL